LEKLNKKLSRNYVAESVSENYKLQKKKSSWELRENLRIFFWLIFEVLFEK
jgi:hypothetical protein